MRKALTIALLAFSVALISANLLAKRVHNFLHPQAEEEAEKAEIPFFPFALNSQSNYIVVEGENEDQTASEYPISLEKQNTMEASYQQAKEIVQPILKLELTDEEKKAVENYTKNKKLRAFISEISGVVSQEQLNQENYLKIAYNPEVRNIFMKYAQDEEFRKMAADVMKDKEVLELAKKIIQNNEVKK